ncbi:MAG: nickel-dependent hydrogenase large subunit, partial [Gammaproteobacteria bacterium]|nr:nickel-dependent hydrogenase large subunit [Gammaproteobacteria bacterium]
VVKIHAILGGKNPHPNFLVGGAPVAISTEDTGNTALNMDGLMTIKSVIEKMQTFVDQVYVPDTLAVAGFYKDWFAKGEGVGNFMVMGDFPAKGNNDVDSFLVPPGVIMNRDLSTIHDVDLNDSDQIREFVAHSWYDYSGGKEEGLHPYDGETNLNYSGPTPPYEHLDVDQSYSWLKSPRWKGKAMEVGPLARVLVMYAKGHEQTVELANYALKTLDAPLEAMFSTLGRTAARTLETKIFADNMMDWYTTLVANIKAGDLSTHNQKLWDPADWPSEARGVGFTEAPRGALAHWIVIKDQKIDNYQAVVPSTWNAGPRDAEGQAGPYEAALEDRHTMHDPKQPLEILRTIHSFDPCIACAVHVVDPDGDELTQIKVT